MTAPSATAFAPSASAGGIRFTATSAQELARMRGNFTARLAQLDLAQHVQQHPPSAVASSHHQHFSLRPELACVWAPEFDTLRLTQQLQLDTELAPDDLEREVLLALLLAPVTFGFTSDAALASSVRVRCNLVRAARQTALAFGVTEVNRPTDCWTHHEDTGFTVRPGHGIATALQKATQPQASGQLYSFSCYRATEYVILLAVVEELAHCNPALLAQLQKHWERRAIMSGQFHDVFLHEYGAMEAPVPPLYYVPGDRVWFRNPDPHSSDVTGYEGSWVIYLGSGVFTNFWKRDQPFTLTAKCVELFHWRHATWTDSAGQLQIDERLVEERVKASLANDADVAAILKMMMALREPQGVYESGGCIDRSREYPRSVWPEHTEVVLPAY